MAAAYVQGTGLQSSGSVASLSKAFTSNVTAGNLIVVGGVGNGETLLTTGSATDGLLNTYTRDINRADAGAQTTQCAIYSAPVTTGGACTVTLDPTGSDFVDIAIAEFSGMDISGTRLDTSNFGDANGTNAATGNLVTSTTTAIVGILSHSDGTVTLTPGASFAEIFEDQDATDMPFNCEYRIAAAGTYTANWTNSSVTYVCVAAAYKQGTATTSIPPSLIRRPWRYVTRRVYR
jgi:hypothetical protein